MTAPSPYDLIYHAEAMLNVVPSLHQIDNPNNHYWIAIVSKAVELGLAGVTLEDLVASTAEKEAASNLRRAELIRQFGGPAAASVVKPRTMAQPANKAANTARLLAALAGQTFTPS